MLSGHLTWLSSIRPTDTADEYEVRLEAEVGLAPEVFVESPELVPDADGRLPHVYPSGAICLHRVGEWRAHMLYINTVIPWAAEWLFYYELWRASGTWCGDGANVLTPTAQSALLHPYQPPRRPARSSR